MSATPRPQPRAEGARAPAVGLGLLLTVVLVGLHLEFHRHAGPLWRDEVNGVNVATMPSVAAVLAASHLDSFPVVWVGLLSAWTAGVGETDVALRRLGLLVGLATLGALWWTGRRLRLGAPLATLLLFAMSPSAIIYGDSVRGYGLGALAVILCAGAVWTFVERPTRRAFLVAQVAAVLAVQTYFPNALLLLAISAGAGACSVRRRAWRTLGATLALGAVAALSLVTSVRWITYAFQVAAIEQGSWSLGWLVDVFRHALAPGVPLLGMVWAAAAALAIAGFGMVWASRPGPSAEGDEDRALFAAVAASVGLVAYFGYLRWVARLPTQYWYYLSLMALVALACDVGCDLLARRFRRGEVARLAAVALAAALVTADVARGVEVRMTNLDLVAAKLAEVARPDDLVVVVPWYCGITFARYYRGPAPWITLPDFDEHKFHLHLQVAEKMKQGDAGVGQELERVERTLRAGGRIWVVGVPVAPPDGESPPPLPPAPTGPERWQAAPYLDAWELRLGALLRTHGRDAWSVPLSDPGPVNAWENLPLIVVEGWR